jgi:ferredoxin
MRSSVVPVVSFYNEYRAHEVKEGANLREEMLRLGVRPYRGLTLLTNCRGRNFCGTCAVEIVDGKGASPRSQDEEATLVGNLAIAKVVGKNLRLACQTSVVGDMVVKTHPKRDVDRARTKERLGLLGIVMFFLLSFLGMSLYLGLDMVKLF